jgi:uncharacterized protein YecT (DUF1311 family)
MRVSHFLATTTLVIAIPAFGANEPLLSPEFAKCSTAADGVTPATMECQGQEWNRQDKRLNIAYRLLLAKLSPKKSSELRTVQRAWVAYAEAKCGFYFDGEDFNGSLNRVEASYCAVVERARRAEELERLAKW